MGKIWRAAALLASTLSLFGCASITSGTTQSVSVQTTPMTGAECQLVNEKGSWTIAASPGSTTITRAYGDLVVSCTAKDGSKGSTSVQSTTVGSAFGNIIAGGIIGAAVDMSSGAAYQYPSTISVTMAGDIAAKLADDAAAKLSAPSPTPIPASAVTARPSPQEIQARLKQLLDLKEQKLIPEEEYTRRVRAIVDEL
jgi:hypothetical protein